MYVPPHFLQSDPAALHAAMDTIALATLVSHGADGMLASHVPLLLDAARGAHGVLRGHLARANPQARQKPDQALAIFLGPEGYISPGWYASKREHGKVVPTWNYIAVHASGRLRWIEDGAELLGLVHDLTERHEAGQAQPWAVSDAPADFIAGMLRGIIGFELEITGLQGKWKLGQNRQPADIAGSVAGLRGQGADDLADAMEQASPMA
ncbi:FMN-binding negative transcriptional regulator [Ferrovibrio sp.]|uniref:FMN-binding negative transcriptional regulator n=1 Tax=Ferrovibrio sp. TaxID=1917215 RepID=UPI0025C46E8B|nr:FMN-binding negative transcriptional regulator [Ferrovibrio sp.]MBX3455560.1 FMN-binding negative transcriptional regulator [Ferrovibrio sp.]